MGCPGSYGVRLAHRLCNNLNAEEYSLTGWVKNCPDGTVECELSGEKKAIKTFLEKCQSGPILSSVKKIYKEESF